MHALHLTALDQTHVCKKQRLYRYSVGNKQAYYYIIEQQIWIIADHQVLFYNEMWKEGFL